MDLNDSIASRELPMRIRLVAPFRCHFNVNNSRAATDEEGYCRLWQQIAGTLAAGLGKYPLIRQLDFPHARPMSAGLRYQKLHESGSLRPPEIAHIQPSEQIAALVAEAVKKAEAALTVPRLHGVLSLVPESLLFRLYDNTLGLAEAAVDIPESVWQEDGEQVCSDIQAWSNAFMNLLVPVCYRSTLFPLVIDCWRSDARGEYLETPGDYHGFPEVTLKEPVRPTAGTVPAYEPDVAGQPLWVSRSLHVDGLDAQRRRIDAFQTELVRNHALGSAPYYDELAARCIGCAKANALGLGGTGVTVDLYRHVCRAVTDIAPRPQVPLGCSYSCGDAIPGAHWAAALLDLLQSRVGYRLRRKEGLALINGTFVHVGLALSCLPLLQGAWSAFLLASRMNARLCRAHRSKYTPVLADEPDDPIRQLSDLIRDSAPASLPGGAPQDPISLRGFPQVAGALAQSMAGYLDALDQALAHRSDNPLIDTGSDEALSQGSFLAPQLTVAAGQLIDAIVLATWMSERRTHHLLIGRVTSIPANASRSTGDLGLIQVPKLMTAVLEEMRLRAGRRTFASGGSTSYGIEDLWTFGVNTSEMLTGVLGGW
jgi:hypothetical protein